MHQKRPFELSSIEISNSIDTLVDNTFADIQSNFLLLPKGNGYVEYSDFQNAYENLKKHTNAFFSFSEENVWNALSSDSLSLLVLRTILGVSPPEWADLARSEFSSDVPQGAARGYDTTVREDRSYLSKLRRNTVTYRRICDLVKTAIHFIQQGAPTEQAETLHRLAKIDTQHGFTSLQHVASAHVPYAILLYERYLGRPFASHRDSVSELVGDVMESAIETTLSKARITFRKTKRAERVPGFEQAPDFFIPTELSPSILIEAKITGDDGTARDKVSRIKVLANMRDERRRANLPSFQLVACIDGRGFGVRRQDMKDLIFATEGKVFTLNSLEKLIEHTDLKNFLPKE